MADRATGRCESNPTGPDQTTGTSDGSDDPDTTNDTNPDPADGPTAGAETGDPPAGSGARPTPTRPPAPGPAPGRRPGSPNPRYLALLRADVEALRRGHTQGQELCEITGIGPIPVPVARDLLGDAILKPVITSGVDVLNVTHLGRGPTAAQRAALLWASPTCAVEGCHRTRVEYDHREDYARTRHTRLDELDPLCQLHHDLKTYHGWALIPGTGKRPIVPPDDPRHPRHPRHQQPAPPPGPSPGQQPRGRPAGRDTGTGANRPTRPTRPSPPPGPTRRRTAAAQPTLPDPPGDPSPAAPS